jgi:hypothetical protein
MSFRVAEFVSLTPLQGLGSKMRTPSSVCKLPEQRRFLMENRELKEWRILQRWLKLQKRAQNETNRGRLAKILNKMGSLIIQMENDSAA